MKIKKLLIFMILVIILLQTTSCKSDEKAEYKITVSGQAENGGVISYLGYEMNVYKDQASNPCGDCPDQPVSIYVGADSKEIIEAISKAITRADDIWTVEEQTDTEIILIEKETGTAEDTDNPTAPEGIMIDGKEL